MSAHALREYLEAILVAVLLAIFAKAFVFEAFQIPSASMEDRLLPGDHVLVNKFVYAPHRGPWAKLLPYRDVARNDVAVFRYPVDPSRDFIKRIVAVGGDGIEMTGRKVLVNGIEVSEPFTIYRRAAAGPNDPEPLRRRDTFGPVAVPADALFALGDNRDASQDSRFWGPVPRSHVRGRAVFVYWSYEDAAARSFSGRGAWLRRLVDTALHFFQRTRWERSFRVVR